MNTHNEQKKIKLRFMAIYGLSLVLIFIVVSAFWQKKSVAVPDAQQASGGEEYFIQFDTLLHTKLGQIDNMYTLFLKNPENSSSVISNFFVAKNSMTNTLDSIAQQAAILTDGSKKNTMEAIVRRYKNSLEIREKLIGQLGYMPKDKPLPKLVENFTDTTALKGDTESLRNMIAERNQEITRLEQKVQADLKEKNDVIVSLQTQLRQRPPGTVSNNSASDGEWKQKYNSLKTSFDKVAESEKALRNAYKTVAEDNRRLLGQIQSLKKD